MLSNSRKDAAAYAAQEVHEALPDYLKAFSILFTASFASALTVSS